MLFSRTWQYAIRLLLELARFEPGEQQSAREVARQAGIPSPYAAKLLSILTAARIVRSQRGPRGGVMLARQPREISLLDVATAVGELHTLQECILGFPECGSDVPCPVHATWGPMREDLKKSLLERTLADFRGIPGPSV